MQFFSAARAAAITGAVALLLVATGCGGGGTDAPATGDTAAVASETASETASDTAIEDAPLADAMAYTVSTQELLSNVQFTTGSSAGRNTMAAPVIPMRQITRPTVSPDQRWICSNKGRKANFMSRSIGRLIVLHMIDDEAKCNLNSGGSLG